MQELANPNLAVCGRLSDNSFRDIRNYPQARQFSNAVVIRMDARLNFTNARKLKEFTKRALKVREQRGDKIEFAVIDAKSINHVDLTGCEMLESLAETLHFYGAKLVLANLKGPVSKCLLQADVPKHFKEKGAMLCTSMDAAVAIIEGQHPQKWELALRSFTRISTSRSWCSVWTRPAGTCMRPPTKLRCARARRTPARF